MTSSSAPDVPDSRNVLLTGATGFVGRHLAGRLLANGRRLVCVLRQDRSSELVPDWLEGAEIRFHDGTTECMVDIVRTAQPSACFHLASLFKAEHSVADVTPLVLSNVLLGTQLCEALASTGLSEAVFVNVGTSWEHFLDEPYDPVCLYAATKRAFADILKYYVNARGLHGATLALFDTYGPDDDRPKLMKLLREACRSGASLAMSGGEQLLDMVHVDDVVDALLACEQLLVERAIGGAEEFAVSSGDRITLRQLVELYGRYAGCVPSVEWGARPYRQREVMVPWSNGRTLPGWKARVRIEEGLARLTKVAESGDAPTGVHSDQHEKEPRE